MLSHALRYKSNMQRQQAGEMVPLADSSAVLCCPRRTHAGWWDPQTRCNLEFPWAEFSRCFSKGEGDPFTLPLRLGWAQPRTRVFLTYHPFYLSPWQMEERK